MGKYYTLQIYIPYSPAYRRPAYIGACAYIRIKGHAPISRQFYGGVRIYTEAGNRRRASYTTVAGWVFDVWRKVATEHLILRGFRQRGYIGWDGDLSTLHSKLSATVESRELPIVVIKEMNAFLEEMKMAEAEENRPLRA